jgi:hypothetical protein
MGLVLWLLSSVRMSRAINSNFMIDKILIL